MAWGKITSVQSSPHINRIQQPNPQGKPQSLSWNVNSEYPWFIASGNNVLITSGTTLP